MAETIEPQMGLNFEQVWAALMENRRQMQETDRQMKEGVYLLTTLTRQVIPIQRVGIFI
jgi:hypothetical protein